MPYIVNDNGRSGDATNGGAWDGDLCRDWRSVLRSGYATKYNCHLNSINALRSSPLVGLGTQPMGGADSRYVIASCCNYLQTVHS